MNIRPLISQDALKKRQQQWRREINNHIDDNSSYSNYQNENTKNKFSNSEIITMLNNSDNTEENILFDKEENLDKYNDLILRINQLEKDNILLHEEINNLKKLNN